jgi:hypothetical protein
MAKPVIMKIGILYYLQKGIQVSFGSILRLSAPQYCSEIC